MSHYGVFHADTGMLLRAFSTTELHQVSVQSAAPNEVVLPGDYSSGSWRLGADGWPEQIEATPVVTADQVKYVARRRLEATDWMVTRHRDQVDAGQPTSLTQAEYEALLAERQAIRAASNTIEQMDPIPEDFWQDHYWSAS